jgi:hypothetical protein
MKRKIDLLIKDKINDKKKKNMKKSSKSAKIKKTPPIKRGRRINKILNDSSDLHYVDSTFSKEDKSAIIVGLKIDPKKLKKMKGSKSEKKSFRSKHSQGESDHSSDSIFHNDIPKDDVCYQCVNYEKIINKLKSKIETLEHREKDGISNKFYHNKLSFISFENGKKMKIKKTSMRCWWDTFPFQTLPCFLPEFYHKQSYYIRGCFCSFNCALAYNLYYLNDGKIHERKALVYKLYRELCGLTLNDDIIIKEAPPRELLKDYGGKLSIEDFRKKFTLLNRDYIVYIPPLKPINMVIEEKIKDDSFLNEDLKYVLQRSKPLSKKRSIISSMKMKY